MSGLNAVGITIKAQPLAVRPPPGARLPSAVLQDQIGTALTVSTACPGCGGTSSHRYEARDDEKTDDGAVTSGYRVL